MPFDAHGAVQGSPEPQPVVQTPTPTPDPVTPEQAATPAPNGGTPNPAATPDAPKWEPNFKFKVMDKEHEIDEFVRGAIKDADTEKKVRELYEKAYGLDVVKPRFHETREELKSLKETHSNVMQGVQDLRELYSQGDFDGFFERLKIPQEKILQWVIDKAQYSELPPEQRQVLDARRQAEKEASELRKQNQNLGQQYEEALVQARNTALQVELTKPDVSTFAEAFDSKGFKNAKGEAITFMDAVIETGEYAWYASKGKVDLSPEQAIQEVMARYGAVLQPQTQTQTQQPAHPPIIPPQGAAATTAAQVAASPKKTSTIPNVAGRQTSSVAKPKPKTLEDLKKLASQMGG